MGAVLTTDNVIHFWQYIKQENEFPKSVTMRVYIDETIKILQKLDKLETTTVTYT